MLNNTEYMIKNIIYFMGIKNCNPMKKYDDKYDIQCIVDTIRIGLFTLFLIKNN